jgi:hypothetical protein
MFLKIKEDWVYFFVIFIVDLTIEEVIAKIVKSFQYPRKNRKVLDLLTLQVAGLNLNWIEHENKGNSTGWVG